MPKIEQMYAFVSQDNGPNDEGIMACLTDTGWLPLVGADVQRVVSLCEIAERMSEATKTPFRVLRFSVREDVTELAKSLYSDYLEAKEHPDMRERFQAAADKRMRQNSEKSYDSQLDTIDDGNIGGA